MTFPVASNCNELSSSDPQVTSDKDQLSPKDLPNEL